MVILYAVAVAIGGYLAYKIMTIPTEPKIEKIWITEEEYEWWKS